MKWTLFVAGCIVFWLSAMSAMAGSIAGFIGLIIGTILMVAVAILEKLEDIEKALRESDSHGSALSSVRYNMPK